MAASPKSSEFLRFAVKIDRSNHAGELERLAAAVEDWDEVVCLAREHRVSTLLYRQMAALGCDVPAEIETQLATEHQRSFLLNMSNALELVRLLKELEKQSIAAMPFKGVVLAASVYGDLAARPAGDLDMIIDSRDLVRATAVMQECGYALITPIKEDGSPLPSHCYELGFERLSDESLVELRFRLELIQPRFTHNLGLDWVWTGRRTASVAGAEVPDMCPEIALLVLCMHGCRHLWSRLIWIRDVAQLIAARPALDWQETIRQAKANGLIRPLALGVLLASRVTGAPVPEAILRSFESDSTVLKLARHMDENLFDAPGTVPPSHFPFSFKILDSRDRFRAFFSPDFLLPNARDKTVFPLPKPLYPLYAFLRPLRILLDRSPRR
jgi:hypothetical protein